MHQAVFVSSLLTLLALPAAQAPAVTLLPAAQGYVRVTPELGSGPLAVPDWPLPADYFKTTATNRTIRRSMLEYAAVPAATSAQLQFRVHTGSSPTPGTILELHAYDDPADLLLSAEDFDRSMTLVASFDPAVDGGPPVFSAVTLTFDVTDLVNAYAGSNLGFQVRAKDDLATSAFTSFGYGLYHQYTDWGAPRLIIEPIPEPGTALLLALGLLGLAGMRRPRQAP